MVFCSTRSVNAFCLSAMAVYTLGVVFLSVRLAQAEAYSIPRHISYAFTVQNSTDKMIPNAEFWSCAPVKITATQRCTKITASHPFETIADELGNQFLHFAFQQFPPFAMKIISVDVDLLLSEEPLRENVPDINLYLRAEKYIEVDDLQILNKAKSLSAVGLLPTAESIARWVSGNIRYTGYLSGIHGAVRTRQQGSGDCTEHMYLFVALCRANRIPARCLEGFICRGNSVLHPGGYHNWAEVYHDSTWRVVDPSNKNFMQNQMHYIAMRIMNSSRGSSNPIFHRYYVVGEELKVTMN